MQLHHFLYIFSYRQGLHCFQNPPLSNRQSDSTGWREIQWNKSPLGPQGKAAGVKGPGNHCTAGEEGGIITPALTCAILLYCNTSLYYSATAQFPLLCLLFCYVPVIGMFLFGCFVVFWGNFIASPQCWASQGDLWTNMKHLQQ